MDNTFFDNDTFEVHKNQTEFDKYGVWVKKPPRSLEENTSLDEKQEESVADTILQDTQVETPQDEISQTPNAEPLEELSPIDEAIISLPEMTTETETNDSVLPKVTETQAEDQTETVLHQDITLDPLPQQEQQQDGECRQYRTHHIHRHRCLCRIADKVDCEACRKHKDWVSGRVTDFKFVTL